MSRKAHQTRPCRTERRRSVMRMIRRLQPVFVADTIYEHVNHKWAIKRQTLNIITLPNQIKTICLQYKYAAHFGSLCSCEKLFSVLVLPFQICCCFCCYSSSLRVCLSIPTHTLAVSRPNELLYTPNKVSAAQV